MMNVVKIVRLFLNVQAIYVSATNSLITKKILALCRTGALTMTNCINCGAPLNGNVCEYCGTQYEHTTETLTLYSDCGIELEVNNILNPTLPLTLNERRKMLKMRGVPNDV